MRGTDYVFHLAALWLYECVHEPRKALEANVVGTYNVIEAAQEAGVKKVVYSSSASVYGNAVEEPMTEDHPFHNRTMYGATKIAGEQFFRAFHERHGLDYVGHRYMNIYGPRMDYRGTYVSVIMKVLDRIDEGLPPLIYGDGSHTYDFVHVADVARANILSLKAEATDTFFNIGTGLGTTINELVGMLLEITGSDIEPEYLPQEQVFVTNRIGSTELAEQLLGFRAEVDLRAGPRVRGRLAASRQRRRGRTEWLRRTSPPAPRRRSGSRSPSRPSGPRSSRRSSSRCETGWVVQGPFVGQFEERFAAYTGAAHAVATTSCTTALHLAVAVLGLKPGRRGDRAGVHLGLDGQRRRVHGRDAACSATSTWTRSTSTSRRSRRSSARAPSGSSRCTCSGCARTWTPVNAIARRHGLWVLEDAACAFGAWQHGRHAGTLGDLGAFSFHPRKSITTGEGGMLTTARADWDELARSLRDHGADRSDLDRHDARGAFLLADFKQLGFNYRMTDIQGALGCAQMDRADWILDERRRRAALYDEALAGIEWLRTPVTPAGNVHGYQSLLLPVRAGGADARDQRPLHELRNARDGANGGARHRDAPGHARPGRDRSLRGPLRPAARGLPARRGRRAPDASPCRCIPT